MSQVYSQYIYSKYVHLAVTSESVWTIESAEKWIKWFNKKEGVSIPAYRFYRHGLETICHGHSVLCQCSACEEVTDMKLADLPY